MELITSFFLYPFAVFSRVARTSEADEEHIKLLKCSLPYNKMFAKGIV